MINQMIILYVAVLLISYAICTQDLNSNHIPLKCSHWTTCRHMKPGYTKDFTQRNCECDNLCSAFKDCCVDAKAREKYPHRIRNRLNTCFRYGINDEAIYVVGSCPRYYKDSIIVKRLCEKGDDFQDPIMYTPVSVAHSATTYRSRYCALCNGALSSVLIPWKMYLKFDDSHPQLTEDASIVMKKNFTFSQDLKKWGVYVGDTFRAFEVVFQKPDSVSDVRLCRFNLISSCPSSWRHDNITKACHSYMGVVHHYHRSYRNVHCAICNGVRVRKLTCSENGRFARSIQPGPFFHLLNYDEFDTCENGQVYDPFLQICRDRVCLFEDYELRGKECHKKNYC